MIIKSIELENIRSYKKEIIDFDLGINFLSGDIGSGKSTILLAIEFAFFGFKKGDLEGFELLRKGESKASIKLILEDSGEVFEIFRSVKKQKSSEGILQDVGYIIEGGNLLELSPSELNSYVFNLLNFPKEFLTKNKNLVYRFSVYTPQENLKSILFDTSESRLEVIRKIFGIDKYKQLLNSFDVYLKKIREDKKVFDVKLERKSKILDEVKDLDKNIKDLEKNVKKFESEDLKLKDSVKKYKEGIEKRDFLIDKLSNNLVVLEKKKSVILEIEEQIKSLKDEIVEIEKEKKNIKNLDIFGQSGEDSNSFDEKKIQLQIEKIKNDILKKEEDLKNILNELKDLKILLKEKDKLVEMKQKFENEKVLIESKKEEIKNLSSNFDYVLTKCQVKDLENFILKDKLKIRKLEKSEFEYGELNKKQIETQTVLKGFNFDLEKIDLKIKNISKLDVCDCCLQKVSKEHREDIEKSLNLDRINIENLILDKKNELHIFEKNLNILEKEVLGLNKIRDDLIQKDERLNLLYEKERKEKVLDANLKKLKLDLVKLTENRNNDVLKKYETELLNFKEKELEIDKLNLKEKSILDQISKDKFLIKDLDQKIIDFKNLYSNLKKKNDLLLSLLDKIKIKKDVNHKILDFETKNKKMKSERDLLKGKYQDFLDKSSVIGKELMRVKTDLKSNCNILDKNKKDLIDIAKIEKDYSKLIFNENFLRGNASEILFQIERSVFSKYYAEFNDEFERLFKELIEDNDIDVRLNSEFSPVIEQNGYDVDVKNLSGGEKSSLAIAYRLGLKKIIESNLESKQKLSLLILDEPTDGFSNEQIDRLGNILKDTNLKQILLVSHDEKIESIADNVLHIEKINHKSHLLR